MLSAPILQFNPEVWGTVSDWTSIFLTTSATILLYLTFRSQITVQKAQQAITEIEYQRHLREIAPALDLDVTRVERFNNDKKSVNIDLHFMFTICDNKATNIKVDLVGDIDGIKLGKPIPLEKSHAEVGDLLSLAVNLDLEVFFDPTGKKIYVTHFLFEANFNDVRGNAYTQNVNYLLSCGEDRIYKSPPTLTNEKRLTL